MNPTLLGIIALLSIVGWAAFIFWPDSGAGRFSPLRQLSRRVLFTSWRWQIRVIRRYLG